MKVLRPIIDRLLDDKFRDYGFSVQERADFSHVAKRLASSFEAQFALLGERGSVVRMQAVAPYTFVVELKREDGSKRTLLAWE